MGLFDSWTHHDRIYSFGTRIARVVSTCSCNLLKLIPPFAGGDFHAVAVMITPRCLERHIKYIPRAFMIVRAFRISQSGKYQVCTTS